MIAILLRQKEEETSRRAHQAIDDAVQELRQNVGENKLRRRIEKLEQQLQELRAGE
jgi:hypothetical protein